MSCEVQVAEAAMGLSNYNVILAANTAYIIAY